VETEYVAPVEGPGWFANFLRSPPSVIEERFSSLDEDVVLSAVTKINPRLAAEATWCLNLMDNDSFETVPAASLRARFSREFQRRGNGEESALLFGKGARGPVSLRAVLLRTIETATKHLAWDIANLDWTNVSPVAVLEESGFRVTSLFTCTAGGMASGGWSLYRVHIDEKGYLLYEFADDQRYEGGVLLVGWEPANSNLGYRAALEWAYHEYGRSLSFPFTRTDIEVERIRNERLFRAVARSVK
jgi:hypothetical protein